MAVWTLARHSFKEAIRKRILVIAGLFALALALSSFFLPVMSEADRVRLVEDMSLTPMAFLGVLLAVFISAYSIPSDIEEKRIFSLATKPVRRHEIFLGKLLGFAMVFAAVLGCMGAAGDIMIRMLSTTRRVEVAAPEAPIFCNGAPVGSVAKGTSLRVLGTAGGCHEVELPDDLAVKEGTVRLEDASVDRTSEQVTVTAGQTDVTHGEAVVAVAAKGQVFGLKEIGEDHYAVYLPVDLRVTRVQIEASATSAPQRTLLRAARIVTPAPSDLEILNRGTVEYGGGQLRLNMPPALVGERWRFEVDAERLPPGDEVDTLVRVGGILGTARDENRQEARGPIDRILTEVQVRGRGGEAERRTVDARWSDGAYTLQLKLARKVLAGGGVEVQLLRTTPEFEYETVQCWGARVCVWHFRGLNIRRFPSEGKLRGEMTFELQHYNVPAHGGYVAEAEFEVGSSGRSEVLRVPVRNRRAVEFSFSREMVDHEGNVDVLLRSVPDPFRMSVQTRTPNVRLLEQPASFEWSYFKAIVLIFCQLLLIGSVTIAASTYVSGGVAALVGFFTYFTGMLVEFMRDVLSLGPEALSSGHHHGPEAAEAAHSAAWPFVEAVLQVFVRVAPDVSKLDAKGLILKGLDVPASMVWTGIGMTLAYVAIAMLFAWAAFRRREFG